MSPRKEAAATQTATTTNVSSARKPWVPKTPVEVVLEQIQRQEDRVAKLQAEIDAEKTTLTKLQKAKEFLESA
jgi:hypothetical protein